MSAPQIPQPRGDDWRAWGGQLVRTLLRQLVTLNFKGADDNPSENGIILWDDLNGYPVVSKDGEFRQVILKDGHYQGLITSDVVAASADTAYPLTYTATISDGISNGTPTSRIVFAEGGSYYVSFTAQIRQQAFGNVEFRFWPRVNGIDVSGSTMVSNMHNVGATLVVSRGMIFSVSAGDYLEAMWSTDNVNAYLEAVSSTAWSPGAPASTIAITRLHA